MADTESPAQGKILASARAAFSSWWSLLGIIAASVTGFNLARHLVHIQLSAVVTEVVARYQSIVHTPVVWLNWERPPTWAIDMAVLWLLIGGTVLRSAWVLRAASVRHRMRFPSQQKAWRFVLVKRHRLPYFVALSLFFWPIVVGFLFAEPYVHRRQKAVHWRGHAYLFADKRRDMGFGLDDGSGSPYEAAYDFLYDLRIVLAMQTVVALFCVFAWFTFNALHEVYG